MDSGFAEVSPKTVRYTFGDLTFDVDRRALVRADAEVHLSPKAFDLLRLLVEARPRVVTKGEILEALWPDTFVSDANLPGLVTEIRGALGDAPRESRFVRTHHRVGYAFTGPVTESSAPVSRRAAGVSYWAIVDTRQIELKEGENVLGRDPECAVWVDAPGVSRRHARIVIDSAGSRLDDLGSKNGTSRGDSQVRSSAPLADGDQIRVGSVLVTFRVWSNAGSTRTEVK